VNATFEYDDASARVSVAADGTLAASEQQDAGSALMSEVRRAPTRSLLVDLRRLNSRGELTLETVSDIADRWATFAAERAMSIRFAIVAGAFRSQAEYFAKELLGSSFEVRVFSTKARAVQWLDLPERVDA
jgi:hypothetical protein